MQWIHTPYANLADTETTFLPGRGQLACIKGLMSEKAFNAGGQTLNSVPFIQLSSASASPQGWP